MMTMVMTMMTMVMTMMASLVEIAFLMISYLGRRRGLLPTVFTKNKPLYAFSISRFLQISHNPIYHIMNEKQ
jgi:hypothetical protein